MKIFHVVTTQYFPEQEILTRFAFKGWALYEFTKDQQPDLYRYEILSAGPAQHLRLVDDQEVHYLIMPKIKHSREPLEVQLRMEQLLLEGNGPQLRLTDVSLDKKKNLSLPEPFPVTEVFFDKHDATFSTDISSVEYICSIAHDELVPFLFTHFSPDLRLRDH